MPLFGPPDVEKLKEKGDVKGLIKAIDSYKPKDWKLRDAAVKALSQLGDPRAVKPMIAAVKHKRSEVRDAAATALERIGAPAVASLIRALTEATRAQAKIGTPASFADAWMDRNLKVIYAYERALKGIGPAAVEPLLAVLESKEPIVRSAAIDVLGTIGDARAAEPIIAALQDPSGDVRQSAALELLHMGDARAVEPLIVALKDKDERVRIFSASALGRIGDGRAVDALVAALKDDGHVRQSAAKALAQLRWKPDRGEAGAWYWITKGDWEKCIAIGAPAVEPLVAALYDEDNDIRLAAAEALGKIGDPRALELLITALKDKDYRVPGAAAQALGLIGDPRAVEPLIAILPYMGGPAAEALGRIKDPRAVDPLIAELSNGSPAAALALGIINDPRAVVPLIAALRHKNENLRETAARSLVWIYRSGELKADGKKAILSHRREIEIIGEGVRGFYVDFPA